MDTQAIETINKELSPVAFEASTFVIASKDDMTRATTLLSLLAKYGDTLKKRRLEATAPIEEGLKSIRDIFRPVETKVKASVDALREAMSVYQTEADRLVKLEEEAIARRVGEGKGHLKPETAMRKMDAIDKPEAKVVTEAGQVSFRTDKLLKITDIYALKATLYKNMPHLLVVNESELLRLMKGGQLFPGAKIEEKKTVINKR